jgi:hypothetical protein
MASDIGLMTAGSYASQLQGQVRVSTEMLKSAVKAQDDVAKMIEESAKITAAAAANTGGINTYA